LIALATGVPGLRLGSLSLAMVSFFLVLLVPDFIQVGPSYLGGFDGLAGIPAPNIAGITLDATGLYFAVIAITCIWLAAMRNLVTSRHGTAFHVLRASPILATSLGIPTFRLKLVAYILGGIPAGIAGVLFAYLNTFVHPNLFSLSIALSMLAGSILGGSISVYGAVLGALLVEILPVRLLVIQSYSDIIFGCFLVVVAIALSNGAAGLARDLASRVVEIRPRRAPPAVRSAYRIDGRQLTIEGVSKSFGGVKALSNVSVTAKVGQITAIVGPNGSGKTTLLNVVSGLVRADSGKVQIGESETTKLPPHRVAEQGVSRTFQTPIIPASMSTIDVVSAARAWRPYVGILTATLRLPKFWRVRRDDESLALMALTMVGAEQHAEAPASELALGTRRLVELSRALISNPAVMLLDEPASGLESEELALFAGLLQQLRSSGATIVLVEHNFPFVLSLADTIYVMDQGKVLESGPPQTIANDPKVIEVYIGSKKSVSMATQSES
jgi:branched-chain amino acid transport system permease protein